MKHLAAFFFFLVLAISFCSAQKGKIYTVQPGENIQEVIPKNDIYAYSQFQTGIVTLKNGARSSASFNYNFLLEDMQFISMKGDTLVILNVEEVESIVIGKDQYYYADKRFVKLDTIIGEVKLAKTGFFMTVSKKKLGAYGITTDGGTDSYTSMITPTNSRLNLTPSIVTTVAYKRALFIGNKYNRFVPITKKNVYSFYQKNEAQLKTYLQQNQIDFFAEEDVIKLVVYMSKL